jgi:hypothetical protein
MRDKMIFAGLAIAGITLVLFSPMVDRGESDPPVPESAMPGPVDPTATLPEGHPPIDAPAPAPGAAPGASPGAAAGAVTGPEGTVLETIDGGGYTYVLLDTDDGELWTAGPTTELDVGERVALSGAMQMGPFTSKALDRDFDNLVFTNQYVRR